ncbi:MAG: hypothetical protein FJ284_10300 [Planctomycetes bacterium]|nr:hypothetical protein [Planctomycetota bacterium]
MPRDHGTTLTRLFVSATQSFGVASVDEAFAEFVQAGWEEQRDPGTGFRCLIQFDADIDMVRRAVKRNPGMMFTCYTLSCETDRMTLNIGFGGAWMSKTRLFSDAVGLNAVRIDQRYVSTSKRRRKSKRQAETKAGGQGGSGTGTRRPRTKQPVTLGTVPQVRNRLVFHGLPAEVERCRELAIDALPAAARPGVKYTTNGTKSYVAGSMEITTEAVPALTAFNKLVAQVPAVTVVLEYDDLSTGGRRQLRAIDGRIGEHRAV